MLSLPPLRLACRHARPLWPQQTPRACGKSSSGGARECTLVLLRHGESEWNRSNRFTGWCDVALTVQGEEEAVEAGDVRARSSTSFSAPYEHTITRLA